MHFSLSQTHNLFFSWKGGVLFSLMITFKHILSLLKQSWIFLRSRFLKILFNLYDRPKLKFEVEKQTVWFSKNGAEKRHYPYFCVKITNQSKKQLHLNLYGIYIGNVLFQGQQPNNLHDFDNCESKICLEYKEKWVEISHGNINYDLQPYATAILPTLPVSGAEHAYTNPKNDCFLFFPKSQITISLKIDGKRYDYGISNKIVYPKLINYLAFHDRKLFEKNN